MTRDNLSKDDLLNGITQIQEYKDLKKLINRPNMFRILGQSHTERWHSAFWSWLFDVHGSHNLGSAPLQYLFEYLSQPIDKNKKHAEHKKPKTNQPNLPSKLDITKLDINKITTKPNEKDNREEICDNSRFDTYIDGKGAFTCIIEYKVEACFDRKQIEKYCKISEKYKWEKPIFIYVVPETRYEEFIDFYKDLDDKYKVWFCLSFQDLYDSVIKKIETTLQEHRNTILIDDYTQNMFMNHNGIKLAYGDKELELSKAINDKYRDNLLKGLIHLYEEDYSDINPKEFLGDEYDTIMNISNSLVYKGHDKLFRSAPVVKLNDTTIDEKYYYQVLVNVIDYFEENGLLEKLPELKKDGWYYSNDSKTKRATIKTTKEGMDVPKQSKSGNYYIESKYGKTIIQQIINNLIKDLRKYSLDEIKIKYVMW